MTEDPVRSFDDLLARLDRLADAAEQGSIDPVITDYLRMTRDRLVRLRERTGEERRLAPREEDRGKGRLVVHGVAYPVEIVDRSATGFGLRAFEELTPETYARLDIDGESEEEIHEGLITYCRAEGDGYRIGLDIASSLRIG
ncbi:MAG: hypothetical protein ACLFRB_06600 [Thiohalorhabdus sp.]|uniref:hypothetical protein n=1 Tax=Thiohalorhabdus sp. TaxID=3094134 RepID=UPI0039801CDE